MLILEIVLSFSQLSSTKNLQKTNKKPNRRTTSIIVIKLNFKQFWFKTLRSPDICCPLSPNFHAIFSWNNFTCVSDHKLFCTWLFWFFDSKLFLPDFLACMTNLVTISVSTCPMTRRTLWPFVNISINVIECLIMNGMGNDYTCASKGYILGFCQHFSRSVHNQ